MRTLIALSLLCAALTPELAAATVAEQVARGEAALERGDLDAAAKAFEAAITLDPKNAKLHYTLGTVYGSQAQKANVLKMASLGKKAKSELDRAVELDPDYIPARFALLEFYLAAPGFLGGSPEKASAQAVEIGKRDALEGHRAMARIYSRQKKTDLARKEYVDAVREQPKSAKAHYFLGVFLMTDKNWTGSLHEFEMALELDPAFMPTLFRLGQHAARSGTNYARGEESLRRYLAYKPGDEEPGHANAWYWLGQLQEKQGKKAEAKASYGNALKLAPTSEDVKTALKRVS